MTKLFFYILFILFANAVSAQVAPVRTYTPSDLDSMFPQMNVEHIEAPNELRTAALIALSHYPTLHRYDIELRYTDQKTTMSARPQPSFIFKGRKKRKYIIRIDNQLGTKGGILIDNAPFNAQVGVIGHELAHVQYYKDKSAMGVIIFGVRYLFPSFREKVEKETDEATIKQGLGYPLRDWSDYVFNHSKAKQEYLEYKRKFYYTEDEIDQLIEEHYIE